MDADETRGHADPATVDLLQRVRGGGDDAARARDQLAARFLPILRRWARGRLPARARDLAETDDLVQVTLVRALDRVETFEHRGEGSFLAYLRRILVNQIRDQARRGGRRPPHDSIPQLEAADASPLERAIGGEALERYEAALDELPREQHEAVVLRVELGYSWPEVAAAVGIDKPNTARMMVTRALAKIAERMDG